MTSEPTKAAQIVNVALFMLALVGLGGLLVAEFIQRSPTPELSIEENRALAVFQIGRASCRERV